MPVNLKEPTEARAAVLNRTRYQLGLCTLLLAFLAAPLVVTMVNLATGKGSAREESLAPTPRFDGGWSSLTKFPGAARWYFTERFGLKDVLVRVHAWLQVSLLGTTSSSAVLLGKEGWLFLASDQSLDYQRGANPLSPGELNYWIGTLKERQRWLAERNIRYAFVVAPNAHTVYPEFLPDDLAPTGVTRLDQLLEATQRDAPDLNFIDLRPALLSAKGRAPLFFKTDTHWTPLGSWFAANEIAARLGFEVPGSDPWPALRKQTGGGDLARMLGLAHSLVDEEAWPAVQPLALKDEAGNPLSLNFMDVTIKQRLVVLNPDGKGTALIFRDSFGEALVPWLSALFARTVWIKSYLFPEEQVLLEQPDIVIEQIVERKLMNTGLIGKETTK